MPPHLAHQAESPLPNQPIFRTSPFIENGANSPSMRLHEKAQVAVGHQNPAGMLTYDLAR